MPATPPAHVGRRTVLGLLAGVAASAFPLRPLRALTDRRRDVRALGFVHTHTGETLDLPYFEAGHYLAGGLDRINHFLRDFRTGEVRAIDPALLDLLVEVREHLRTDAPYHIISGYRSPATNAMLRRTRGGQASKSLHMVGKAVDVRLPGVPLARLRDAGYALAGGGVGYYPGSNFVHLDTGRDRRWGG